MSDRPRWKPRMMPPYWGLLGVLLLWALHEWLPGPTLLEGQLRWLGVVPILAGVALAVWGARQLRGHETGVIPGTNITAFVRTGPYRRIRNPMYVGMALVLTGAWLAFGTLSGIIVLVLFVVIIDRRFIVHEQKMLRERFGDEAWNHYASSTRRWL